MPSAEIITIGTEILLGEIVDTNSAFLARNLRDLNVDVFRTSTIGDNTQRIAEIIRETLARTQIIITTGGLGPTVDDPTREAVASAFGVETEYQPELWQQIVERLGQFGRIPTENQKRQAYIPAGAIAIKNPVGTAPAFIVEQDDKCVISLPGVPREMEYLYENNVLPYLRTRYQLTGLIKARILHVAGLGESLIDEQVGEYELLENPTVGLAAHYGIVDIRITAKATTAALADEMIAEMEKNIRTRLSAHIYGADDETLEGAVLNALEQKNLKMLVVEINTGGQLTSALSAVSSPAFLGGKILAGLSNEQNLKALLAEQMHTQQAQAGIGLISRPETGKCEVDIVLITPDNLRMETRGYGGHPKNLSIWGSNTALDMLRRIIKNT